MGCFDFDKHKPYGRKITAALARRGLVPVEDDEWQVHGPHGDDLPEPIFIGWARPASAAEEVMVRRRDGRILVTVYPRAVCEIEDGRDSRWWDTQSDNLRRIPVRRAPARLGLDKERPTC